MARLLFPLASFLFVCHREDDEGPELFPGQFVLACSSSLRGLLSVEREKDCLVVVFLLEGWYASPCKG